MSISQAVILCAGKGTRLNDSFRYTPEIETPKPLIEVGGKPFLTYPINMLKGIGITDIVLLVDYMKERFEFLESETVRLVQSQENVNKAVLAIPDLDNFFVLLNGDCFPIMDWRAFISSNGLGLKPRVAVKIVGRDAGIALVSRNEVVQGKVDCSNIFDMMGLVENYTILGGLHIGTYQGLERARQFMSLVVFGQ